MGKPVEMNLENEHLTKTVDGKQGYYLTKQKILLIIIAVLILCTAVALVTGYAVNARTKNTGSYCFFLSPGCTLQKKQSSYGIKYSRMDQVKFFKGCLLQILLGPFLNTLPHMNFTHSSKTVRFIWNNTYNVTLFFVKLQSKPAINKRRHRRRFSLNHQISQNRCGTEHCTKMKFSIKISLGNVTKCWLLLQKSWMKNLIFFYIENPRRHTSISLTGMLIRLQISTTQN